MDFGTLQNAGLFFQIKLDRKIEGQEPMEGVKKNLMGI